MSIPQVRRQSFGFTLIEVMVAIAIGMVGILAIFRTMAVWNVRTQTTSSGGEAQISGTLAMYNLERDLKAAGMGIGTAPAAVMGCSVVANTTSDGAFTFNLVPVAITQGVAGAPDTISVLYGNSSFFVDSQAFTASTGSSKTTKNRAGLQTGDLVIVAGDSGAGAGSAPCQLIEVTNYPAGDVLTIDHAAGSYTNFYGIAGLAQYNGVATPPAFTSGTLHDLGPAPRLNVWTIKDAHILTRTDTLHPADDAFDVAEGIVNMQAEYGIDADGNGIIDAWSEAPPVDGNWTGVRAVRVALLARSRQFEKEAVTGVAPLYWDGRSFTMTAVDGGADSTAAGPNNWRHYRYRVYEQIIPLRNMIWGTTAP